MLLGRMCACVPKYRAYEDILQPKYGRWRLQEQEREEGEWGKEMHCLLIILHT